MRTSAGTLGTELGTYLSEAEVDAFREDTPGIAGVRPDTPGCIAHFNAAGAALPPFAVLDAQLEYLRHEAVCGGYETAEEKAEALHVPYAALASLLNCEASEIAITQSATSAWQCAFGSLLESFEPGDRVLTAQCEYASNYIAYLQAARVRGIVVETVPSDENGELDIHELEERLSSRHSGSGTTGTKKGPVKLVSVTHVPTSGGLVNDAEKIGALTQKYRVPFLLDACQSVGQMPIDVQDVRCDFLVGTGRKYLRGPRGIGFLYARSAFLNGFGDGGNRSRNVEPVMLDLHGARWDSAASYVPADGAKRFEQYEVSFCAKAGLGVAVQYALDVGIDRAWRRTQMLASLLREGLGAVDGVTVRDSGRVKCGIATFDVRGVSAAEVKERLHRDFGVNVWTSCVVNNTRMEWERRRNREDTNRRVPTLPEDVIRASAHYYNTEWEIQKVVAGVTAIARRGGATSDAPSA
jgi:selenocysteine lyase/cysteine desulfurase